MNQNWLESMKKSVQRGVIDLLWKGFTDDHVMQIIEHLGPELGKVRQLYLGGNDITPAGMWSLAEHINAGAYLYYNNARWGPNKARSWELQLRNRGFHFSPMYFTTPDYMLYPST